MTTNNGYHPTVEVNAAPDLWELESGEQFENTPSFHLTPPLLVPDADLAEEAIEQNVRSILYLLGEDPEREGLLKTPLRVRKMYRELLSGYTTDPEALINGALFEVDYHEPVIVRDIEFQSLCEHHMLPFLGRAHVAYIPSGRVIGLSKIPRIVDMFARRLQVQERMTAQIADFLEETLQPSGVAVVVEAAHLCATMRGVRKANARMVTSTLRGEFKSNETLRREFLHHISRPSPQELF